MTFCSLKLNPKILSVLLCYFRALFSFNLLFRCLYMPNVDVHALSLI